MTVQNVAQPFPSAKLIRRYRDSYRVAAFVIVVGGIVQLVGFVISVAIGAGGYSAAVTQFRFRQTEQYTTIAASLFTALVAFVIFFIAGVLVRAQGQSLRASLDCAVHSSPFLTNEEKASAMRL